MDGLEQASAPSLWNVTRGPFGLAIAVSLLCSQQAALAQAIAPDSTLGPESSVVVPNVEIRGVNSDRIDGGAIRNSNLFHSFQEFNVEPGRGAYFSNPAGIDNILTRVTGANLSNIDGVLGVLGDANLFLINPNGLIFGPGARLDLNGSFIGSTAESILFEEYGFSAVNPSAPPMLTLNVPIGLQIGENPGEIVVRSQIREITSGEFAEMADAGDLVETAQTVNAVGELPPESISGELAAGGDVDLFRLSLPEGAVFSASTVGGTVIDTTLTLFDAEGRGIIGNDDSQGTLQSTLPTQVIGESGEVLLGVSSFPSRPTSEGGEIFDSGFGNLSPTGPGADLPLNGEASLGTGSGPFTIFFSVTDPNNDVGGLQVPPGETLALVGGNIRFEEGRIDAPGATVRLGGLAEAGVVDLEANRSVSFPEGIVRADLTLSDGAQIDVQGSDSGSVTLTSRNLRLQQGSRVSVAFFTNSMGEGTAGDIDPGQVSSSAVEIFSGSLDLVGSSQINTFTGFEGDAGDIVIETGSLSLTESSSISSGTFSSGNTGSTRIQAPGSIVLQSSSSIENLGSEVAEGGIGEISLETGSLYLDESQIRTATFGVGGTGMIQIQATDSITLRGGDGMPSIISNTLFSGAEGDGGDIIIETAHLTLDDGSSVNNSTGGIGDGGAIQIQVIDSIIVQGESGEGFPSSISSSVLPGGVGDSGNVSIETDLFTLKDGGSVDTETAGAGDGGVIRIQAFDSIVVQGESGEGFPSFISSSVLSGGIGNSGNISIETNLLSLEDGTFIATNTEGNGNAGAIQIRSTDSITLQGESGFENQTIPSFISSLISPGAEGNSQGITIETTNLSLNDGATLTATTLGVGDAGAIQIQATDSLILQGEARGAGSSITSIVGSEAEGSSRGISIEVGRLSLDDGADIIASTNGNGNAGAIHIQATDSIILQGMSSDRESPYSSIGSTVEETAEGNASPIEIVTPVLTLSDGAFISVTTGGAGDASSIIINASDAVNLLEQGTGLFARTFGAGSPGDIQVTTPNLTIGEGAELTATVTEDATNLDGGGNITLNISNFSISGELGIFAETNSIAPAGNLTIQPYADDPNLNISFTADGFISTQTTSSGAGGRIDLSAPQALSIEGQGNITASTTAGSTGASGSIFLTAPMIDIHDAALAVDSQGTAPGGSIIITANDLSLDRSEVTASTTSTDGGNITLDLGGILFLHDESLISTTAGTAEAGGNGGIIDIDSRFIVAFPSEGTAGSDITANAFEGTGGSIDIESDGLFGIAFQDNLATPRESASNDITVTSTFGDPGNLTVNSPEVDPASALVDLPETGVELAVQDSCQVAAKGSLAFYKIGRGGLPLNGSAAAEASTIWGWTPIEEEVAEVPLAIPDPADLRRVPFQVMPAGDFNNLQNQLASLRFVPACRPSKNPAPTQMRLEE